MVKFKGSSRHGRLPSLVEHKQLPFPAVPQTPAQTYMHQTSHPQGEWENVSFHFISFFCCKLYHSLIKLSAQLQEVGHVTKSFEVCVRDASECLLVIGGNSTFIIFIIHLQALLAHS